MNPKEQAEQIIRLSFEATFAERVDRRVRVKPHSIIPDHYFSAASVECRDMFVAGYFYGCISLVQAVAEGVSRFVAEANSCPPGGDPQERVRQLHKRGFIGDKVLEAFDVIWRDRNDFHHLNRRIEVERNKLAARAEECVRAWFLVESDLFGYTTSQGKLVPKNPKYWPKTGSDTTAVYVDFE